MTLLHLLSYVGIIAGFAFIVLSLASGLLWISEIIEEHSTLAKTVGIRAIYIIIALQILLYIADSLPLGHTIFSIICNIVYLQNFSSSWPIISLTSVSFIASCILSISNHFLWFFYFSRRSQGGRHRSHGRLGASQQADSSPGFADVATYFALCVWLVPLFLFLSLSANDNALPISSGGPQIPTSPTAIPPTPVTTSRSSLFKSIIDIFLRIRRGRASEGLIVSHTPSPSAPSTPFAASFGQNLSSPGFPSSPRQSFSSSNDGVIHYGVKELQQSSMKLRPPPKRNSTGPAQGARVVDPIGSRRSLEEQDTSTPLLSLRVPSQQESTPIRRRPTS